MGFIIPDLVVESILRDGFKAIRNDLTIIDDIFSEMKKTHLSSKYGEAEIAKIKDLFLNKEIALTFAFSEAAMRAPSISIQLLANTEDVSKASLDDFGDDEIFDDAIEEADLIVADPVTPTAYDTLSGIVSVDDATNLGSVTKNQIFKDAAGTEHTIIGAVINETGSKAFVVAKGSDVDISDAGLIKSSIDWEQYELRRTSEREGLLLGMHTKDRLTCIYIYIVTKYILLSRKKELVERGFYLPTYSGSDFTRNLEYQGDRIYSRYLTINTEVENTWSSDKVIPFENIELDVLVPKDEATTENLDLDESTVQIGPTDQDEF